MAKRSHLIVGRSYFHKNPHVLTVEIRCGHWSYIKFTKHFLYKNKLSYKEFLLFSGYEEHVKECFWMKFLILCLEVHVIDVKHLTSKRCYTILF